MLREYLEASPVGSSPAERLVPALYQRIADTPGKYAVLDLSPEPLPLLNQTLHGKPITSGSASVPRVAVRRELGVEHDLNAPNDLLSLNDEGRAARLAEDRDELIRLNFRFVVLPESSNDQWSLAQELGLRHVDGDVELSLWEVPFENSSR